MPSRALTNTQSIAWDFGTVGQAKANTRTDFSTPSSPQDGDFWIEASGTSPNRVISLKIRDGGATYTLASIQR
jgi:hypothetical protein